MELQKKRRKIGGAGIFSYHNRTINQEIFHVFLFLYLVVANRPLLSSCGLVIRCARMRLSAKSTV